jgi:uncharacterized membrane protein
MNNNIKTTIGMILILIAFIAMIVAAIWSIVFNFQNPDMTDLRLVIENPGPTIIAIVSLIGFGVGKTLIGLK